MGSRYPRHLRRPRSRLEEEDQPGRFLVVVEQGLSVVRFEQAQR